MTLKDYLEFKNKSSVFKAELTNVGGVITFSNSGKRGSVKSFSLGLDSFQTILEDIHLNISKFDSVKDYEETPWRDLGSQYFTDGPANAMSTVQTKPLFSTLSKIITWANYPKLEHCDTDQFCPIEEGNLLKAIDSLKQLKTNFTFTSLHGHVELESMRDFVISLNETIKRSNLVFDDKLVERIIYSNITKPFLILTGLSGSGKTKLAQAFAMWLCGSEEQYKIVPVGADWTNREPLLGFPNALQEKAYVRPESGVLDLILKADNDKNKPYFLILDEMNLSHVERYFADFLSTMESGEEILLHAGDEDWDGIPLKIRLPKNLFIVGTVNIDETTYMFSPKVLDRANVIEFRVTAEEMTAYLNQTGKVDLDILKGLGASMEESFVALAQNKELNYSAQEAMNAALIGFFSQLKVAGAEFGYRTASEIRRFAAVAEAMETHWQPEEILDVVIMQKLLPKLHGSRRKLEPVLKTLITLCLSEDAKAEDYLQPKADADSSKVLYPIALEKLQRMYRGLIDNGFTSYAEA